MIDGIGGGIGAQIVERLRKEDMRDVSIPALGANAIRVSVASTDYILGPIGIVLPNAAAESPGFTSKDIHCRCHRGHIGHPRARVVVAVVNIDNGFGAGYMASMINLQ